MECPVIETNTCIKGYDYKNKATYNEYSILKTLGGGAFGRVVLAQKNHTFELFAIKQPKRKKLCANDLTEITI